MASCSSAAEAAPPWTELPREITSVILHKLGAISMLWTAQRVCTAWRSVCRDPSMWRCIDIRAPRDSFDLPYDYEEMFREAVDYSQGQVIDINIKHFGSDELLLYISERSSQLRCLQLTFCHEIFDDGLNRAVKNFPLLEELHLYYIYIRRGAIEVIGRSCPLLKSFKLNTQRNHSSSVYDMDAREIAQNMPQLRHLQLIGNNMTDEGLQAILDGCPHLESLDLRLGVDIHFGGNLDQLCTQKIRDLKRPHESIEDYRYKYEHYEYEYNEIDIAALSAILSDFDESSESSGGSACSFEDDYGVSHP